MGNDVVAQLRAQEGRSYVSDWITVDQSMIDDFADTTRDWNFLHVDPDKAVAAGFDSTIAHGFLTLSLLAPLRMSCDRPVVEGMRAGVNYGLEGVRFLSPVPSGSRVRGRFDITSVDQREPDQLRETMQVTVEIEGFERPALVAQWLTMYLL